jgi:hypothetical protein
MPYNRQYMGTNGAFTAASVLFPPQASIRITNTSAVNDPESPITLMRAAPNPNEIWRVQAGDIIKSFLFDTGGVQMLRGEVYIGKVLLGGLGTRWYHVQPCNMIAGPGVSTDINFAQRLQQTMRVHPGEELVLALNDGGTTAWAAADPQNQVQIPYEVAGGVTPQQMAASLRAWG